VCRYGSQKRKKVLGISAMTMKAMMAPMLPVMARPEEVPDDASQPDPGTSQQPSEHHHHHPHHHHHHNGGEEDKKKKRANFFETAVS